MATVQRLFRPTIVLIVTITFLFGWTASNPKTVLGDSAPLSLRIEAGYDGQVKLDKWFPAYFTIVNSGDDLSGDLVVQIATPNGGKDIEYISHVDLPSGSTKVVGMTLPGMMLSKKNNAVLFYKDSINKGKQVKFAENNAFIETSILDQRQLQFAVMAKDIDTLNFLPLVKQKGVEVKTIRLTIADFPTDSMMLDGLDAIVLNDIPSDQFKPEQIKAMKAWIERGGRLLIAGGAGYAKTAAPFTDIAPVTFVGTESLNALPSLAKAGGKELVFSQPFTISKVSAKGASILFSENNNPLFASKQSGKGEVWYAAYDLALNPIASWNGNAALWLTVLTQMWGTAIQQSNININFNGNGWYELNNALDNFQALVPPSFGLLLIVILLYAIVIGPILYFILKRIDRRGWAWAAIPLFAVVFSLGIYGVGASGRGSTLSQTLNMIDLNGSGLGWKTSAVSIFVPSKGKFDMSIPDAVNVSSLTQNGMGNSMSGSNLNGAADLSIAKELDKTTIQFKDVSFWSIHKAWLQSDKLTPYGKLDYTLNQDAAGIHGEVTNQTNVDLTKVTLLFNQDIIEIGDMKRGDKKSFASKGGAVNNRNIQMDIVQRMFPYTNVQPDSAAKQRSLASVYFQKNMFQLQNGTPLLIGWSRSSDQSLYRIDGKPIHSDELNMWVQAVQLHYVSGSQIAISASSLTPLLSSDAGSFNYMNPTIIHFTPGHYTMEYKLPRIADAVFSNMTSFNDNANSASNGNSNNVTITYEIWNEVKQAWEPLDANKLKPDDAIATYLISGNALRLRMSTTQEINFRFPDFTIEGKVKP